MKYLIFFENKEKFRLFLYKFKFWRNPKYYEFSQKFKNKFIGINKKTFKFIDARMGGKYFKRFILWIKNPFLHSINLLSKIVLNGSLVYLAYTGVFSPLVIFGTYVIHTIIGIGIGVWYTSMLITKAHTGWHDAKMQRIREMPTPRIEVSR